MNFDQLRQHIHSQLDMAGRVLEATYNDQAATEAAIKEMNAARHQFDARLTKLMLDVTNSIENLGPKTATKAATLLQSNFKQADEAAQSARIRYEGAARHLGWKMFGMTILSGALICGASYYMLERSIPPQAEIDRRWKTIADLDADITQLKATVAQLELRGGRLTTSTCIVGKAAVTCFRTDEGQAPQPYGKGNETYRLPWYR